MYIIKVSKIIEKGDTNKYESTDDIYVQKVEQINLNKIIEAVNPFEI